MPQRRELSSIQKSLLALGLAGLALTTVLYFNERVQIGILEYRDYHCLDLNTLDPSAKDLTLALAATEKGTDYFFLHQLICFPPVPLLP